MLLGKAKGLGGTPSRSALCQVCWVPQQKLVQKADQKTNKNELFTPVLYYMKTIAAVAPTVSPST